jgi:hypothetical protein
MYIFYKIYLQWIYWTLFFIACCSTIFASELPESHGRPPYLVTCEKKYPRAPTRFRCVCLTIFKWHSTSNLKCHLTFSKTKMNVNWHLHFLLKCHLNVTCLIIHRILILNVSIGVYFFLHKSHHMSNSKLCISIHMHFLCVQVFPCQMSKTYKNFVKTHTTWFQSIIIQNHVQIL